MIDLSGWHFVHRLVAGVANGWQIHVGLLLGDLDALESIN